LGDHQREILGAYGEYIKEWFADFTTTIGAYALHTDFVGFQVYPGAEFQLRCTESSALWGNWGTGQRLPTYTDWYYRDPANSSNPNLKSERAQNLELGYRYQKRLVSAQISVFQKSYTDMIDWVRNSPNQPWTPNNIANLTFRGAEWEFKARDFMPVLPENSEVVFNACVLDDSEFDNGENLSKNALNFMTYQQNTRLRMKLWEGESSDYQNGVYLTGIWRLVKRTNGNAYHLFDAKLEFSRGKSWNAYVNFMNIANTEYREIASVPLMPRWFGMGIAAKL
jgi:iron complex outermembrane receptor protein